MQTNNEFGFRAIAAHVSSAIEALLATSILLGHGWARQIVRETLGEHLFLVSDFPRCAGRFRVLIQKEQDAEATFDEAVKIAIDEAAYRWDQDNRPGTSVGSASFSWAPILEPTPNWIPVMLDGDGGQDVWSYRSPGGRFVFLACENAWKIVIRSHQWGDWEASASYAKDAEPVIGLVPPWQTTAGYWNLQEEEIWSALQASPTELRLGRLDVLGLGRKPVELEDAQQFINLATRTSESSHWLERWLDHESEKRTQKVLEDVLYYTQKGIRLGLKAQFDAYRHVEPGQGVLQFGYVDPELLAAFAGDEDE